VVKKILLVEDDKKISELVKQSLLNEGYFVDQSFDGESGYYKIIEDQPDLVILDINKPYKVSSENILYKCGWSPFLNTTFNSSINTTIVNGHIVYKDSIIQENIPFGKQIEFSR